jgi:hypothetical protein
MTTLEYIDAQETYLARLKDLRQREERNLSEVDFVLFASRFDLLISKVEAELKTLQGGVSFSAYPQRAKAGIISMCIAGKNVFNFGTCSETVNVVVLAGNFVTSSLIEHFPTQPAQISSRSFAMCNIDQVISREAAC